MATQTGIEPGATVTLTGSGAGTWAQTTGPTVALAGSGAVRSFAAPATIDGVTLAFTYGASTETVEVLKATERIGTRPAILWLGSVAAPPAGSTPALTMSATPGDTVIDVVWQLANATPVSFAVGRNGVDSTGFGPFTATDPASATTRRFDKLTNGTAYTITVTATLAGGGTLTQTATVTPSAVIASPALTVTATPGDGQVVLSWSLANATATSYVDGRNGTDTTGAGPWSTTDPAGTTSRTFLKLANGTPYVFNVTANLTGGSTITTTATATPAAAGPVLRVTATPGAAFVDVTWTLTGGTATGYTVSRDGVDNTGSGPFTANDPATAVTRRFDKLLNGTAYTFTVVAALTAGGPLTVAKTATPTTTPTTPEPGPGDPAAGRVIPLVGRSGLPFNSLILNTNSIAGATAFETTRRRPVDGMMWFVSRQSWAELGSGWGTDRAAWLADGRILLSAMPHAPEPEGTAMNAKGANNDYATNQQALAAYLAGAGFNHPLHVIRVDWENNGDWYPWSAKNGGAGALAGAVRNFVTNMRAGGLTQVKFDLCWNKGPSQAGADFASNPGRAYIDVLGIDQYDMWEPATSDAQWATEIARTPALATIVSQAAAKGQMWSLDEGGNTNPASANYGGDNPIYWQKVWQFFNANPGNCAWHVTYDNAGAPNTLHHDFASNPASWAAYRTTFGGF
jgi:hypothetical protein